jgi:hypothetical protein
MLQQHILTRHTQIGCPVLHIRRHVGGADDHQFNVRLIGVENQLAAGFRIIGRDNARRRQQRQGFLEDAAFG